MSKAQGLMKFTFEKLLIISGAVLMEKVSSIKAEGQLLSSLSLWSDQIRSDQSLSRVRLFATP